MRSSGFHNRELKVIIGYRMKHPVFATAACPATALALALIELPLHGVTVHTVLDSPCPELIDQMENSGPHWV